MNDFPVLRGGRIVYLDSASTTLRPRRVIRAAARFSQNCGLGPHRAYYKLGGAAEESYAQARRTAAGFIGARPEEIVFVKNATEGLNLLALGLFQEPALKTSPALPGAGDKAALPLSEHHSNFLPWIRAVEKAGGKTEILYPGETGLPSPGEIETKIGPGVRVAAFALVS
ncbi:MAG: aminotransferase class V-fold PLP-dependent enzyme, partial [Spirochaetales bacterium]|nr:aminotransferase class V-fold PLP-dependent enzyme [Spirochaetales bacterium]